MNIPGQAINLPGYIMNIPGQAINLPGYVTVIAVLSYIYRSTREVSAQSKREFSW